MKSTFDILNDITYKKPDYKLLPSDEFVPFMIQRWISFIHPSYCNLINDIYNDKSRAFSDNQQMYDFLKCIIPKKSISHINYIKKSKTVDTPKYENSIIELSNSLELSKQEIRDMLKLCPDIIDQIKESEQVLEKN